MLAPQTLRICHHAPINMAGSAAFLSLKAQLLPPHFRLWLKPEVDVVTQQCLVTLSHEMYQSFPFTLSHFIHLPVQHPQITAGKA